MLYGRQGSRADHDADRATEREYGGRKSRVYEARMHNDALTDDELVSQLTSLCLQGRRLNARIIALLVEVETRRLAAKNACGSMWDFCVERLGMSHGETSRRLNAARLVRRFPQLLERIERGEIHLSSLKILGKYLDESNVEQLLDEATRKSKLEVQEIVARHFPRPDVEERVVELNPAPAQASLAALDAAGPTPSLGAAPSTATARVVPLSADGYLVQLTMSKDGWDTLNRAKDLMGHRVPSGDSVAVIEAALKLLVAKLEKERLGKTTRPRSKARPSKAGHIAQSTRREVFARDGEQCTFVDAHGRRCKCRRRLELDHIVPRALGGTDEASNLRVVCRTHNRHYAEEIFGVEHVAEKIHCRQEQSHRVMKEERVIGDVPVSPPTKPLVLVVAEPTANRAALSTPGETIDLATKGLVNMGFTKPDVRRALDVVCAKHQGEVLRVEALLREAIVALT